MKLSHFWKPFLTKKFTIPLASAVFLLIGFQNCGQTKFASVAQTSLASSASTPVNPVCAAARPSESGYVACLAPLQNSILAVQKYSVVCQASGSWSRTAIGNIDYSLCVGVCDSSKRLSDTENVACPAPFTNEIKGVQKYAVSCLNDGTWSRSVNGAADYSACSKVCDSNSKPPSTSVVACQAPYASISSGIQSYTVTCNSNGTWSRSLSGGIDYSSCPQSCNAATKPPTQTAAVCPSSSAMSAIQNYSVTCNSNGTWSSVPSSFDSSGCPAATCSAGTKPASTETVACPSPNASTVKSILKYSVSCSGTTWVRSVPTRDDSQCPTAKSCIATKPSDTNSSVSCQAPYASQTLAVQKFTYTCNSSTGTYDKVANGAVDYSACPKSCTGTVPSSSSQISCPVGQVGTAYQNYSVTCNTSTGNYDVAASSKDYSGCTTPAAATCLSSNQPSNSDSVACPAPFADRYDAKKMYSVSCSNGSWIRTATGSTDTSSCPVNDCSGVAQPSPTKVVGSCPSGASGVVTQSCSLTCSGKTWSLSNCSANDYSSCDCGANATYNAGSNSCVAKAATCTPSTSNSAPVYNCPDGYRGSTYTTTTITCPNGNYGTPSSATSNVNNCTEIIGTFTYEQGIGGTGGCDQQTSDAYSTLALCRAGKASWLKDKSRYPDPGGCVATMTRDCSGN